MSVNSLKKTLENSAPKASENLADLECNLDKISSFKASTKNLLELNIKEKTQKLTTLDIPENMSDHTSICLLPDSSLFCYGSSHRVDRRHIYSGITFVITPNYDIKLLTSGQPCYKSGTIYYNGAVFAFGGDNGQPLNLAETYNFAHNLWKKIASLPETSEHCSCSLFKDEILILAQNSKVFSYNPLSNSYSKMIEFHKANIQQLCVANGKAYLLRSKTIHESEFEDASTWRNICNFSIPAGGSISYQIIDDNSIYFMRYYDVYRFDIRKKRVSCIFEHEKFVESDEDHKYKRYEEIYH